MFTISLLFCNKKDSVLDELFWDLIFPLIWNRSRRSAWAPHLVAPQFMCFDCSIIFHCVNYLSQRLQGWPGIEPWNCNLFLNFFIQQRFIKYPLCARYCRRQQGCSNDQDIRSLYHSILQGFFLILFCFQKGMDCFFCLITTTQLIAIENILARGTRITSVQRWGIQGPRKYRRKASFVPSVSQLLAQFQTHQRRTVNICWKLNKETYPTYFNQCRHVCAGRFREKEWTDRGLATNWTSLIPLQPAPPVAFHTSANTLLLDH